LITIEQLLTEAKQSKASDLHLTVGVPPIIRMHGDLKYMNYDRLTPDMTKVLVYEMLSDGQKAHLSEFGEVDFSFSIATIGRFRVNAYKQRGSLAAALRLVDSVIPEPEKLGLPESVVELNKLKRGLVLVTGPTGSGKSTTLASIIAQVNKTRSAHIITLEDPIEYLHKHGKSIVNQREIGLDTNSYSNALRAALRQDPDVILVGEMRDLETISIAVTAAETGHLVLSTLHTTGAVSTIDRVIDVFPPHQQQQIRVQLGSVLQAVISQQLITTADGLGRVAAFEILHVNQAVRNLIREAKSHQILSIMQTNKRIGMQTMDDALLELLKLGKITREQAMIYSVDAPSMQRRIMG
jgi:twitching motility protein PilT